MVRQIIQPSAPTRRRGNPNWGKPLTGVPRSPTAFEMEVSRLRLSKEKYIISEELRGWCQKNRNRIYIPEWLLAEWHIVVDVNFDWFVNNEKNHRAGPDAGADSGATMKKTG